MQDLEYMCPIRGKLIFQDSDFVRVKQQPLSHQRIEMKPLVIKIKHGLSQISHFIQKLEDKKQ